MRQSALSGLVLLGTASAASVAVETSYMPTTINTLACSEELTSTSTTLSTSTTSATVTVTLPPYSSVTPVSTSTSTTGRLSSDTMIKPNLYNDIAGDVTSTIIQTTTRTVIAMPMVTIFMTAPFFVHNFPIVNGHIDSTSGLSSIPILKARDTSYEFDWVTHFTTSTIGAMTLTALVTGPIPPPTTVTSFSTQGMTMNTASTAPPTGVTVVDVTSMVTVTKSVTNSTMVGTTDIANGKTSWLNISTFVITGSPTWTGSEFGTTASSTSSVLSSAAVGILSTTAPSSTSATSTSSSTYITDNVGRKGATTVALDPQSPQSGAGPLAESDGVLLTVAAAMGACVGLALML